MIQKKISPARQGEGIRSIPFPDSSLFPAFLAIASFCLWVKCTTSLTEPEIGTINYSGISGRIAFCRAYDGGSYYIAVIDATNKSSTMTKVTGVVFGTSVALSPTSHEVVFSGLRGNDFGYKIFSLNGQTISKLTDNKNQNLFPVYSANGAFIIYLYKDAQERLMRMNADGSSPVQMFTFGKPGSDSRFSLNKEGNRVAIASQGAICLVASDGSNLKTLVQPGDSASLYDPAWSPQNDKIAFVSRQGPNEGNAPPFFFTILCVDTLGAAIDTIHTARQSSYFNDVQIAWSPDGSQIAFDTPKEGEGRPHIFVVDTAFKNVQQITSGDGWDLGVSWVQSIP